MARVLQILLQRHALPTTLFLHQIPGIGVQFALEPAKVQEEGSRVVISVDDEPESLWKMRKVSSRIFWKASCSDACATKHVVTSAPMP